MYNTNQIFNRVIESIDIKRTHVVLAKKHLLNIEDNLIDLPNELPKFLLEQGYPHPGKVIVHDSIFNEEKIFEISSYFTYTLAFSEAIFELINSNHFIPHNTQSYAYNSGIYTIPWTTVINNGSGTTSSWNFSNLVIEIPRSVKKTSFNKNGRSILFDSEVFIDNLKLNNAHSDVLEALGDTLECFKKELYRPSLTMLGKVVEGAWIEAGISLTQFAISGGYDVEKNEKIIELLMSNDGFAKKVEKIVNLYSSHHKDWYSDLRKESGIHIHDLQEIFLWTNVVRESRNAIHFGAEVSVPNSFEKTSIILLAAPKYLRTLYKLKDYAERKFSPLN